MATALSQDDEDTHEDTQATNLRTTWHVLIWWLALTTFAFVLFGIWAKPEAALRFISAAILLATASASVGGLLGFLFGIPRSLQQEGAPAAQPSTTPSTSAASAAQATPGPTAPTADSESGTKVNTNLEQISDWLTKILVGVGLTQLQLIWPNLLGIARDVADPLGGSAQLALLAIVNFSIWGFFASYLVTRLFLASAFGAADAAARRIVQKEREAFRLTQRGAHGEAAARYAAVLEQLPADTSPDQRRRSVEGLVYNLLYQDPPENFQQAIRIAREYLSNPVNPPSAKLWAYLAAALGQEYLFEQEHDGDPRTLDGIERATLTAIERAISINPSIKWLLRSLWDPNDPQKADPSENDLEVFYPREAFGRLLR